ncbi:MAG TPA: TlpA disulfide reductase family protein [Balneolales bacterium]|nr:TlpA disulfide reductase family protein [Balneolales bacterium]
MKKIIASLMLLFLFGGTQLVHAQYVQLSAGQKKAVENATLMDMNGNKFNVSKYHGKVVMLDFWETWCHPCIASMPTENKLAKEFPNKFVVIAVTPGFNDSRNKVKAFIKNHNYKFHYAYGKKLAQKLMISGIPYKVFLSPKGKFIKVEMGSYGPQKDYHDIKSIIEKYNSKNS